MFAVVTLVDMTSSVIISESGQYLVFDTREQAEEALAEEREVGAYDTYSIKGCMICLESN